MKKLFLIIAMALCTISVKSQTLTDVFYIYTSGWPQSTNAVFQSFVAYDGNYFQRDIGTLDSSSIAFDALDYTIASQNGHSRLLCSDSLGGIHMFDISALPAYTVNAPTPALTHSVVNTGYRPSTTKATNLSITAVTSVSMTIAGGQAGELSLQISPDNITYTSYTSIPASFTAGLAVAVGAINGGGGQLTAQIPKGWYWKWISSGTGVYFIKNIFETPIN